MFIDCSDPGMLSNKNLLLLNLHTTNILVVFPKIRQIEVFDVTNKFPQSLGTSLNEGSTSYRFIQS